jgi:hypothetical protein
VLEAAIALIKQVQSAGWLRTKLEAGMFCARGPEASSKARQACTSPDHAATPSPLGLYMVWPFRNPDHLFANKNHLSHCEK